MYYRILNLFLQFLICCILHNFSNAKAIIGINVRHAYENEFTFVASITYKKRKSNPKLDHICTAVLVTRKNALTAEHCICKILDKCKLLVGSNSLNTGQDYELAAWISYKQWSRDNNLSPEFPENDISVITLQKNVNDPNIKPAIMSNTPINKLYGLQVITAGWGKSNNGEITDIMETVVLNILKRRDCINRINEIANVKATVPPSLICTVGTPFALIGNGESGGPLFDKNNVLIAINVATCPATQDEINLNEVNLHASIKYYRKFIDDIISSI